MSIHRLSDSATLSDWQASIQQGEYLTSLLVTNIGSLCSGDVEEPLLGADRIYAEHGVFQAIGDDAPEVASVVVDAHGTTVMPGLIDGHVHPTVGEYTPAQNAIGWISNYVQGGTTTAVSAGELHIPGLPLEALTPDLVVSVAAVAAQTLGRTRPGGMRVEAGTLLLVPSMTEEHFQRAAQAGVRNAKFIFYDWSKGKPGEAEQYVDWAHARDMTVKIHSGGVSRSGASVVAGYDIIARIRPDVVGHISGGPIAMSDDDIRLVVQRTSSYFEICSSMNYRASLVALNAATEAGALGRLTLGTDTPGGTGVIPRGMLRNLLFLCSVGGLDAPKAVAVATGNAGRAHRLAQGRIEVGAPADFLVCDKVFGAGSPDALTSIQAGDLPGIGMVVIGGRIEVFPRSLQTPPPWREPTIVSNR